MRSWPILLLLAGCNGTLPPVPKEVLIPVPVPCVESLPERPPFMTDAELSKLEDFAFVIELRRDQLALRGFVATQDVLLQACLK